MRKSNEQSLKNVIEDLVEAYRLKGKLNEMKIINSWEKLMGKMIANRTSKIYIINKKLFLHIDSAPLRQELSYSKSKILEIVNREAGENFIDEVILK